MATPRHNAPPSKILVLLNESAGTIQNQGADSVTAQLRSLFAKHGIAASVECLPSSKFAKAAKQAGAKAQQGEADAIVAGGGDGTLRCVAEALAGTGIPLGILPLGTLNHFAKDLRIPLDLEAAVEVIASGRDIAVDVGDANGSIFLNNSSIGIYPFMVLDRERLRRKGLQKWIAMTLAGIRVLRRFPLRTIRVRAEDWTLPCRTPCLFVGNNEYGLGMFSLGRRENLNRGELWLYIAKQKSRLALLWFSVRSLVGLANPMRDLSVFATKTANIDARARKLHVALDGEVEIMRLPLHYRIRAGALHVYAPEAPEPTQTNL